MILLHTNCSAVSDCLKQYVFVHVTGTMKMVFMTEKSVVVHQLS